jgi:hypothetical protein
MEKLSGLVLDVYDDPDGEVLREIFPTYESVPEIVKEAHQLTQEERSGLPDDLFALVLLDGDTVMRKMACVDAGNTALAVEYFMKTAHKLPDAAQKVAAANLLTACGWYDLEPPEELQKVALLGAAWKAGKVLHGGTLGALGGIAMAPGIIKGTAQEVGRGMRQAGASGSFINPAILK